MNYPHEKYGCSGEAAALRAGEGDDGECFICNRVVPIGGMFTILDGRAHVCAACDHRIEDAARDRKREDFFAVAGDICGPVNLNP